MSTGTKHTKQGCVMGPRSATRKPSLPRQATAAHSTILLHSRCQSRCKPAQCSPGCGSVQHTPLQDGRGNNLLCSCPLVKDVPAAACGALNACWCLLTCPCQGQEAPAAAAVGCLVQLQPCYMVINLAPQATQPCQSLTALTMGKTTCCRPHDHHEKLQHRMLAALDRQAARKFRERQPRETCSMQQPIHCLSSSSLCPSGLQALQCCGTVALAAA